MRIETGPYKPEDDWTGYFVRGDVAMGESGLFKTTAELLREIDPDVLPPAKRLLLDCACRMLMEWSERFAQVREVPPDGR